MGPLPIHPIEKMLGPRTVIKSSDMMSNPDMQESAIRVAQNAIRNHYSDQEIAASIRKQFQKLYPPSVWHCFVGRDFGTFVSHEANKYIYFYVGQLGVCLFATA